MCVVCFVFRSRCTISKRALTETKHGSTCLQQHTSMLTSTSPQRRVPLPLSNIPLPEDADAVASEIDAHCRSEQQTFNILGSLTPRGVADRDESAENAAHYDAWKHRIFQPRRPADSSCGDGATPKPTTTPPPLDPSLPPPRPPPGTYRGKKLYLSIQRLFEAIGSTGEPCSNRLGLFAFSLACRELNPMIRWVPVTTLNRNIEHRQSKLDEFDEERRRRIKAMLDEQSAAPTQGKLLDMQLASSKISASLGKLADSNVLADIERKAMLEEEKQLREEQERKRIGEERLAVARDAAAQRKAERARKMQQLMDQDEETRIELEAVQRVRAQLEAEKSKAATLQRMKDATAA